MQSIHSTPAPLGLLVRRWPERRPLVLSGAVALFVAVFASMVLANDARLGLGLLAVVPIVLVALELGQRGGIAAALLAIGALVCAGLFDRPELGALAVAVRSFVFLAVGAAAGHFSDRMRATQAREERLLRSGLRLSAAGTPERLGEEVAREVVVTPGVYAAEVLIDGESHVIGVPAGGHRTRLPLRAHGVEVGRIEAVHRDALTSEDRAALELLASQAALIAENLRLLGLDSERAALETRLRDVRRELLEMRSGAGLVLQAEEADKRRLAGKLHEDLAQVLAAVLLGLRMLERQGPDGRSATLEALHGQVAQVLADVRDVARELRPVVLDQLGLRSAVEALAHAARDRGADVSLDVGTVPRQLPEQIETAVFRLVEYALDSTGGGRLYVSIEEVQDVLLIDIVMEQPAPAVLLALRTRAESVGGRTEVRAPDASAMMRLRVTVPVA
jgi:signal transduction histidine kinase